MGYKTTRGSREAGAEINDGKDFFTHLIEEEFDNVKPMYENLDEDKKTQFKALFEGTDVMQSKSSLESWLNENEDDDEFLNETMTNT